MFPDDRLKIPCLKPENIIIHVFESDHSPYDFDYGEMPMSELIKALCKPLEYSADSNKAVNMFMGYKSGTLEMRIVKIKLS